MSGHVLHGARSRKDTALAADEDALSTHGRRNVLIGEREAVGEEGLAKKSFAQDVAAAMVPGTGSDDERENIATALRLARGKVDKAAKLLGTSRNTLYVRLARHGLRASDFRTLRLESERGPNARKDPGANAPGVEREMS